MEVLEKLLVLLALQKYIETKKKMNQKDLKKYIRQKNNLPT